jgi:predicted nucleic acid-binding protein
LRFHYLDSSAWVKHHVREPGSDWVQRFFSSGASIACSSVGVVEVLSAVSRRTSLGPALRRRIDLAVRNEFARMEEITLTRSVLDRAMDLALIYGLRGADAIHLASAVAYSTYMSEQDDLVFVSSDRDLLAAATQAGFPVVDPTAQ